MRKKFSFPVLLVLCFSVCCFGQNAKYVFLMIGDGMGQSQRKAAELYKTYEESKGDITQKYCQLIMNTFPYNSLTATFSANSTVTDSAAAGTAIATGYKTKNGTIGLNKEGKKQKSIAELAKANGKKVGIITSVPIDHATPASFYAHQPSRYDCLEISLELPLSNFDFFGGGCSAAVTKSTKNSLKIHKAAFQNQYRIIQGRKELMELDSVERKIWSVASRFDDMASLPFAIDSGNENIPDLVDYTSKAIELLDNEEGFFIMVEGGSIDWACHSNDPLTAIKEILAFDDAVAVAYDFYLKHKDETLVVVTADHETGGFSIEENFRPSKLSSQKTSIGKLGQKLDVLKKNKATFEDVMECISDDFGLQNLTDEECAQLEKAYKHSAEGKKNKILYGSGDPILVTCCKIMSKRAGISWATYGHSGERVITSAVGVGAQEFSGFNDNTDIFKKISKIMFEKSSVESLN